MNNKLKQILLFPLFWKCKWHKGEYPMTYDPGPDTSIAQAYCPECGCMLDTKTCERCGIGFLNWEAKGFDDIMAAPSVTESGDLMCVCCCKRWQEDEDEEYARGDYAVYGGYETYEEMMSDGGLT